MFFLFFIKTNSYALAPSSHLSQINFQEQTRPVLALKLSEFNAITNISIPENLKKKQQLLKTILETNTSSVLDLSNFVKENFLHPNPYIREICADHLCEYQRPDIIEIALQLLKEDPDARVKEKVFDNLKKINILSTPEGLEIIFWVAKNSLDEKYKYVRRKISSYLCNEIKKFPQNKLLEILRLDSDIEVKFEIICHFKTRFLRTEERPSATCKQILQQLVVIHASDSKISRVSQETLNFWDLLGYPEESPQQILEFLEEQSLAMQTIDLAA